MNKKLTKNTTTVRITYSTILFAIIFSIISCTAYAQTFDFRDLPGDTSSWREIDWSKYLSRQPATKGVPEYSLPDRSRVDILTNEYAIEVEWLSKWPEAVGQSLYYAAMTGKKPKIIILKKPDDDIKKYLQLQVVANKQNIKVEFLDIKKIRTSR